MAEAAGAGLAEKTAAMIAEELRRGRDWALQLQQGAGAGDDDNNNNNELLLLYPPLQLLQKIISSYDKAIALLNFNNLFFAQEEEEEEERVPKNNSTHQVNDSSTTPPPLLMPNNTTTHHQVFKKRKSWGTQQVRVCSATGLGGGVDDGHSWRKYGQKDILGANHPRAYYRCTHRYMQGCMATKHIQRSDADPSIFEVTYKGSHTCTAAAAAAAASMAMMCAKSGSPKEEAQQLLHQLQKQDEKHGLLLLNNYGLTETSDLDVDIAISDIFPPSVSPTSSDSIMNLPFLLDQNDDYGFDELTQIMDRSESDSVTNSPFVDWHLPAAAADDHQVLSLDAIDILEYFS